MVRVGVRVRVITIHTHIHTNIHTHTHKHTCAYSHTHTHTQIRNTQTHSYLHSNTRTNKQTHNPHTLIMKHPDLFVYLPLSSFVSRLALFSTRYFTTGKWPLDEASDKGVAPASTHAHVQTRVVRGPHITFADTHTHTHSYLRPNTRTNKQTHNPHALKMRHPDLFV
jgi:hypothetical protein